MARRHRRQPRRGRVGQVSYYHHHGAWYLYFREGGKPVRRRVGGSEEEAGLLAAQVNAQLASAALTVFSFTPLPVAELRRRFLEHHELVLRSSLATVRRYRAATQHLENFVAERRPGTPAHELSAAEFTQYLRTIQVAPNGHAHTRRRSLRDKGVRFILEVCRGLYGFAAKSHHLPPYAPNPFAALGTKRMQVGDAKPVFVFDQAAEFAFLAACDAWAFPIHFTLAKTGLRLGELVHLLIEHVDLEHGWLRVRSQPELGWRVKTGRARAVPLISEMVTVLRRVIGNRQSGPVFRRQRYSPADGGLAEVGAQGLVAALQERLRATKADLPALGQREAQARVARTVWRDAGALRADRVRTSFIRVAEKIGLRGATCPKSWRHTFATLLQDANVDPLVRQVTLGHLPSPGNGALGMTAVYTHTRPETQKQQMECALKLWPRSLELARAWAQRAPSY